jgi:GTPase SAR1 family protein
VFDLCNKESFLNVASWLKEVEKHSGEDVTVIVLANKSDAPAEEVEVSDADIKKFEEEYPNLKVIKTSAKTGSNVDESFLEMTKKLIVKRNNSTQEEKKKSIGLKKLKETLDSGQTPGTGGGDRTGSSTTTCCL